MTDTPGQRARRAIDRLGISLNEVDKRLGKPGHGWMTRFVSGQKKRIDAATMRRVADALEVRYEWLAFGEGPMLRTDRPPSSGERVLDIYPNRGEAIRIAKADGAHEQAIAWARTIQLREGEDRSIMWWLLRIAGRSEELRALERASGSPSETTRVSSS